MSLIVLDAPSNLGLRPPEQGGVPGVYKLPWALRDAGLPRRIGAADAGAVVPPRYDASGWRPGDGVRQADRIASYSRRLADRVAALLDDGGFPVVLGGDCSILLGPMLALRRRGRYGLAYVDGADFRHPGNHEFVGAAGGEALALSTGRGQAELTDMDGLGPYVRDEDAVLLGVREDDELLEEVRRVMPVATAAEILRSPAAAAASALETLASGRLDGFWLHVDADVLDPAVMPAVDTPEPGGIGFAELRDLLTPLLASPACQGIQVTIFDPDLDTDGSAAEALTDTLASAFAGRHGALSNRCKGVCNPRPVARRCFCMHTFRNGAIPLRRFGIAALAVATALTAGCQLLGSDDDPVEERDADLALLDSMLEENGRLITDLVEVQERLIRDCLEAQGHSVHDEHEFVMWNFQKDDMTDVDAGALPWLIDRDLAADWGFGVWASFDDMYGSEEHLEFDALFFGEDAPTFAKADNSAFDSLSNEAKFDWYIDYYGEERARTDQGYLVGDFASSGPGGLLGSVKPEGCMGEITAELGLEPEFVPQPDFGEDAGTWLTYPVPPGLATLTAGALDEEVRAQRTSEDDFLNCLEDAGWGRWDFNEAGALNVRHYIDLSYGLTPDTSRPLPEEFTAGIPEELPADVPTDAVERREWESGFALDIWECVDQSGLEADAEQAWANVYGSELLDLEDEVFAWQDDIRGILADAQDLLSE